MPTIAVRDISCLNLCYCVMYFKFPSKFESVSADFYVCLGSLLYTIPTFRHNLNHERGHHRRGPWGSRGGTLRTQPPLATALLFSICSGFEQTTGGYHIIPDIKFAKCQNNFLLVEYIIRSCQPSCINILQELVDNPGTHLYMARVEGEIVGSLSLVVFSIPTGTKVYLP